MNGSVACEAEGDRLRRTSAAYENLSPVLSVQIKHSSPLEHAALQIECCHDQSTILSHCI